jgi:uncharacterized protein (UPF0297 family)
MGDYLEEINVALGNQKGFAYASMDGVISTLENIEEHYEDRARSYGVGSASILGSGVLAKAEPDIIKPIAEETGLIQQLSTDEISNILLVGSAVVSGGTAYIAKRHKDKRDEVRDVRQRLEEGDFEENDAEFAYEVADVLEEPGFNPMRRFRQIF